MSLAGVVAGAVGGLGKGVLMRSERERQDALLTRKENREDLTSARENAITEARSLRQEKLQQQTIDIAKEREANDQANSAADRTQRAQLTDKSIAANRDLAGQQNTLQRDRWDREDRRAIEESAGTQLAALDKRIQTVQDALLKGEYLGKEDAANAELEEAKEQQRVIRYRSIRQLSQQGDPRYKDLGQRDMAIAAGFPRERVVDVMRQLGTPSLDASGGPGPTDASGSEGAPPAAPASPAPITTPSAGPATAPPTMDAASAFRGAAGMGGAAPVSPPPMADLSKKGRGNKAPADLFAASNGRGSALPTVTGRSGAQLTDVGALFKGGPPASPKKYGGGRGAPEKAEPPPKTEDELATKAKTALNTLRSGGDTTAIDGIDSVRAMSASKLRALGYTDQEILKLLRPRSH